MVDHERALVVRRRPAAGLAHQRLKAQLPAGLGRGLEAGQVGVALPEGHRGGRPVEPQRGARRARFDRPEQLKGEIQVRGGAERLLLPDYRQRPWPRQRPAACCYAPLWSSCSSWS